ncbi:MAG: hypothetical protein J6C96_08280 [Oscillospiraceae bacterium]|nr:hypothetical protein [Oscillospiraceae bacterium]
MKNKLRKTASAALSVFMCMAMLAGCGKKDDGGSSAGDPAGSETAEAAAADVNDNTFVNADWTYGQVAMGGGGFVTGVFSTCEPNLYYARTDVGGAYRWVEDEQRWKSLNYWVSEEDKGYLGIDGLAVDPSDASKVYMLAGTEYFSNGRTALLKSEDYGETIKVIELTDMIRVHGNGMGRGNGERIAVDPNNGSIIFAGGRTGGMIKSTDGGETWTAVSSFPVTSTANGNGICSILFDPSSAKDGATQRIYAAVSQKGDESGNLFVSEDGGESWAKLPGSITDNMVQRMKLDSEGNLYVCYINNEGPWNCAAGAIYRYGKDGSAEKISDTNASFGDILIDPNDSNKLIAVTSGRWECQANGAYGDVFFTSTDGGKTWRNVLENMEMDTNGMPWIEDCAIHWCSSLAMDPVNTSRILVNSGNGVFACDNIWDETPKFYFESNGIEETVPMDIITMKDYPLVTAVMDYDGFVNEDIKVSGQRHQDKIGSTTSITIAAQNRAIWAKVGGSDKEQALTYSTDEGKTWSKITNKPDSGKTFYNGSVALTADGSRLIWSPENALKAYYTEDWGATWNECGGIIGGGFHVLGDAVNASYVYACGKESVYVSSDGGVNFTKLSGINPTYKRICVSPDEEGVFYIAGGAGLYKATNHGDSIDLVTNSKYCEAVGIGKPKNDGDPYVIYIYGNTKDSDEKGIYMTEDNGETWVRVNDDAHRFGGTGNGVVISGDMNVYGRCYMSTVGLGFIYCDKIEK